MELLKEVANISGKPGLYRIVKPTRTGVIVETLDEKRQKTVVGANARVSVLKDISIYTQDHQEANLPLGDILMRIKEKYDNNVELTPKTATDRELYDFLATVAPEFDRERVYASDIKKMVSWYLILQKFLPEVFTVTPIEESSEA
jgi:Domain of unknown function (DUF5606)